MNPVLLLNEGPVNIAFFESITDADEAMSDDDSVPYA